MSVVHPIVHPSSFSITEMNINGISPNLVWSLILWRSGLKLLIGKFHQLLTFICPPHDSGGVLLFQNFIFVIAF